MTASMMSFASSTGGALTPEFVAVDAKYKCTLCRRALNQAHQLPCGHRICRPCVDDLFASASQVSCPSGEEDCERNITREHVHPDFSAQREMRRFQVYCCYKDYGCQQTMPWTQFRAHTEQCTFRLQRCTHCGEELPLDNLQVHVENECPMTPCQCPHGCELGPSGILRSRLEEHLDQCPRRPRPCPLHTVGCEFIGTSEELEHHKQDNWLHLILIATAVNIANSGRSAEAGAIGGAAAAAFDNQSINIAIVPLKSDMSRLEARVAELSQAIALQPPTVSEQDTFTIETRLNALQLATTGIQQQLQTRDVEIVQLKRRIQEIDLRCQFLESAGYEGMLLWKIGSFTQRLQDAKDSRVTSLYSPPFYAGRYGNKLCARCYLNGDGIGRGSHISLFFVVMQGDYDDLLVWPFNAKVTLALIDQSGGGRHYSESFRPDPRSTSFQRPTTPMNVASGCPAFISHERLLATGPDGQIYIKSDTLYFRISVEMSEIKTI
jgi:TNF receptor-associated factor 2